jgi:hypothetical protein
MKLILIGVSTRKLGRAMRLRADRLPQQDGDGTSKSTASRQFSALSAERMAEWLRSVLDNASHCRLGKECHRLFFHMALMTGPLVAIRRH